MSANKARRHLPPSTSFPHPRYSKDRRASAFDADAEAYSFPETRLSFPLYIRSSYAIRFVRRTATIVLVVLLCSLALAQAASAQSRRDTLRFRTGVLKTGRYFRT